LSYYLKIVVVEKFQRYELAVNMGQWSGFGDSFCPRPLIHFGNDIEKLIKVLHSSAKDQQFKF
jgi:hypothetical protein